MAGSQRTVLPCRTVSGISLKFKRETDWGSNLTVFFKNLHRRQALNFLISLACLRWSGFRGPFLFPTRFSVSGFPLCDCLRTLVSAVFAAIGLLRDGFLLGGEADEDEPDERVGEDDLLTGTGIGRTIATGLAVTGLTAVGDWEPWEV